MKGWLEGIECTYTCAFFEEMPLNRKEIKHEKTLTWSVQTLWCGEDQTFVTLIFKQNPMQKNPISVTWGCRAVFSKLHDELQCQRLYNENNIYCITSNIFQLVKHFFCIADTCVWLFDKPWVALFLDVLLPILISWIIRVHIRNT